MYITQSSSVSRLIGCVCLGHACVFCLWTLAQIVDHRMPLKNITCLCHLDISVGMILSWQAVVHAHMLTSILCNITNHWLAGAQFRMKDLLPPHSDLNATRISASMLGLSFNVCFEFQCKLRASMYALRFIV